MAIPDLRTIKERVLRMIADGKEYQICDVIKQLAIQFKLTEEELEQKMPSGWSCLFDHRVHSAKYFLKKEGLIEQTRAGSFRIAPKVSPPVTNQSGSLEPVDDPRELLEAAYITLRKMLAEDLLEKVRKCSPAFFERLAVRLLEKMNYGKGIVTGKVGDGGIDGIIKLDKLGLDCVYIQAKRWEGVVGSQEVQRFAGSMETRKAHKGVLITTSSFSPDAKKCVEKIGRTMALIDGEMLTELMIEHDIGVSTDREFTLKKINVDFGEEEI